MKKLLIILLLLPLFSVAQFKHQPRPVSSSGSGITYTTWNPSDINANMVLSGGNLTISGNGGGGFQMGRSIKGESSGKWSCEFVPTVGGSLRVGIALITESLSAQLGSGAGGYAYTDAGTKANNGSTSAYGTGWGTGDKVTMYFDMGAGTIGFKLNGTDQGTAFTGIPAGTYYVAISTGLSTYTFVANFGATALTYPVAGYNQGVY